MAARFTNEREFLLSLSALPGDLQADVDKAHRLIGIAALQKVVLKTPVDLGEARGGWQAAIGQPSDAATANPDPTGASAIANGLTVYAGVRGYVRSFITNGVPHAVVLDLGGYLPPNPSNDPEALARRASGRTPAQRARGQQIGGHPGTTFVSGGYSLQAPQGMVAVSVEELRQEFNLR